LLTHVRRNLICPAIPELDLVLQVLAVVAMEVMITIAVAHLVDTVLVVMVVTVIEAHLAATTMMMIVVVIALLHVPVVQLMTTLLQEAVSRILIVASMLQTHMQAVDLLMIAPLQEIILQEMLHMNQDLHDATRYDYNRSTIKILQ